MASIDLNVNHVVCNQLKRYMTSLQDIFMMFWQNRTNGKASLISKKRPLDERLTVLTGIVLV